MNTPTFSFTIETIEMTQPYNPQKGLFQVILHWNEANEWMMVYSDSSIAYCKAGLANIFSGLTLTWNDTLVDTIATTGTASSGSTSLTIPTANSEIVVGQSVLGAGIAAGTTVSAVSGTTVTLSANTTAALSTTAVTFGTLESSKSGSYSINTTSQAGWSVVS